MTPSALLLLGLVTNPPPANFYPPATWPATVGTPPDLVVLAGGPSEFEPAIRGFAESGARRLRVTLDGRSLSLPVFGSLDTAAPGVPLDELLAPSLTSGPGAGAAFPAVAAGWLDLRTRSVRATPSWTVGVGGGERDAARLGLRGAGRRGGAAVAGWAEWERDAGFRASRTENVALPGQPLEAVSLARDQEQRAMAGFRLDGPSVAERLHWQVGAGIGRNRGAIRTTVFGRAEERLADEHWLRAEVTGRHGFVALDHTRHDASDLVLLSSGTAAPLDEQRSALRAGWDWQRRRTRLVLGAEIGRDQAAAGGPAPFLVGDNRIDYLGFRGSGEVDLGRHLGASAALRWRTSDALPEPVLSSRAELVWSPHKDHRVNLAWGEGHVEATLAERRGRLALGTPLDLGAFERAFGLRLGFDAVPTVAFGNPELAPERVSGLELGYRGTLGPFEFNVRGFQERHRDFVGDYQLGAGPPRAAYQVPATVSAETARRFLATLDAFLPPTLRAALTADAAGRPLLALSVDSGGRTETRGADLYVVVRGPRGVHGSLALGYLELQSEVERPGGPIVLNAPPKRARGLVGWRGKRGGVDLAVRWLDEFEWASGVFRGPVRAATTVDLSGRWQLRPGLVLSLTIDNATDQQHAETFGGDVWGRQGRLAMRWSFGGEVAP